MSFTEDELQAFNSILEQRLAAHRQEVGQVIDQRLTNLQQHIESRFGAFQQEVTGFLERGVSSREEAAGGVLAEKLDAQRDQIARLVSAEVQEQSRHIEMHVDHLLTDQLSGIGQLLEQRVATQQGEVEVADLHAQLETIEVQTDLSWEDLVDVMGKALDERLAALNESLQGSVKNLEQHLAIRLHSLRDELTHEQEIRPSYSGILSNSTSLQEVLTGIEHLERVMESMQVAMTANNALFSNRLYHHQQLPLEKAHPHSTGQTHIAPANGVGSLLTQAKERLASGLEPGRSTGEESMGQ